MSHEGARKAIEPSTEAVVQVLALTQNTSELTVHSRQLLGDGRRLAQGLKGELGAWLLRATPQQGDGEITRELAERGCRVVQRLMNPLFDNWSSELVVAGLADALPSACRVILLPGTARGEEVAGLLSARLDAPWIPDALTMSVTRTGSIEVTAVERGGKLSRPYRVSDKRPIVLTMREDVAEAQPRQTGDDASVFDVEVDLSETNRKTRVERHLPADARTVDIVYARRIVAGGRGTGGPDGMEQVASLCEALDASLAASRMVVDLGWAPLERQVGQTGKTVRPDLYVACGISGASHHLAGMRDSRHIVAVNTDRKAPIHEIAHLSLYGDLHQVVPAIETVLTRRRKTT